VSDPTEPVDYGGDNYCPTCNALLESEMCEFCDDGQIEVYEDDPMWYSPGDTEQCDECNGRGYIWHCPTCGYL
jgi:hypothetical protein